MRVAIGILILINLIGIADSLAQVENKLVLEIPDKVFKCNSIAFLLRSNNDSIIVTPEALIYNPTRIFKDSNELMDIDFGQYYKINDLRYFVYHKRLFILFFITESNNNYSTLYSFDFESLKSGSPETISKKMKWKYFKCCNVLTDYKFSNDSLSLIYDVNTITINILKDLKHNYVLGLE